MVILEAIDIEHSKATTLETDYKSIRQYKEAIDRAKEFMRSCLSENITVAQIASHVNISPFHFYRIFKQQTQSSPYQYLLKLRLQNAELLLKHTSNSITDICFSSGFNSIEHFATMFRSKYKKNPSEFRKSAFSE